MSNAILVVLLIVLDYFIYLPFFKVYEKQLLAQEAQDEQDAAVSAGVAQAAGADTKFPLFSVLYPE